MGDYLIPGCPHALGGGGGKIQNFDVELEMCINGSPGGEGQIILTSLPEKIVSFQLIRHNPVGEGGDARS